jgi:hypothetical protein
VPTVLTDLEQLTPAWLSEALQEAFPGVRVSSAQHEQFVQEAFPGVRVSSAQHEQIAEGQGFMCLLARVRLDYAGRPPARAPSSLVVKIPNPHPTAQALGTTLRLWENEARFYRVIAPEVDVRLPACYFAVGDADTGAFVIGLEDLGQLQAGDTVAGATDLQARLAVQWLAGFEATWWDRTSREDLRWMPTLDQFFARMRPRLEASLGPFMDLYAANLPRRPLAWVEPALARLGDHATLEGLADTVVHVDYRLDNLLFDGDSTAVAIDWQSPARGRGLYDLANFIVLNIDEPQRRATERALVERYRRGLAAGGVDIGSGLQIFDLYRESVLDALAMSLIGGTLDQSNQRAVELFRLAAQRTYTAADDLDIAEFIR